jgi:hypothetical protein
MTTLKDLGLSSNPFEPATAGAPIGSDLWLPRRWEQELRRSLQLIATGRGVKALAISGEYGGGKSYILQWLYREELPNQFSAKPFYFDNPGVQFYSLANSLLRQIGRKEFAKMIWELASNKVEGYQRGLFTSGFEEYLRAQQTGRFKRYNLASLQDAIREAGIVDDEEIADRLARIVTETSVKPYFEYRDFIAGKAGTLVAEGEEAPYFGAILRTLRLAGNVQRVAFLVDEFEEVSLQKKLTRREAHDYLSTLKRLINLTKGEDLWLVVAMTPDGVEKTQALEPALGERFASQGQFSFKIPPLDKNEATELVKRRLVPARLPGFSPPNELFPFPDNFVESLTPATFSNPRRLVKSCFYAIGSSQGQSLPFSGDFLRATETRAYPSEKSEEAQ